MSGSVREGKTLTAQIAERCRDEVLTECNSSSQDTQRDVKNIYMKSKREVRSGRVRDEPARCLVVVVACCLGSILRGSWLWMDLHFSTTHRHPNLSSFSHSGPSRSALRPTGLLQPRARLPPAPAGGCAVILPCSICTRALNARYGQPQQPTAPSCPLNRHPWAFFPSPSV